MFHGPSYGERASAAVAESWTAQTTRIASKCLFMMKPPLQSILVLVIYEEDNKNCPWRRLVDSHRTLRASRLRVRPLSKAAFDLSQSSMRRSRRARQRPLVGPLALI